MEKKDIPFLSFCFWATQSDARDLLCIQRSLLVGFGDQGSNLAGIMQSEYLTYWIIT